MCLPRVGHERCYNLNLVNWKICAGSLSHQVKTLLLWDFHAVRKLRPYGEAMCTCSSWQPQLRSQMTANISRLGMWVNKSPDNSRIPALNHLVTPATVSSQPRPQTPWSRAILTVPCSNSWPMQLMSMIKWLCEVTKSEEKRYSATVTAISNNLPINLPFDLSYFELDFYLFLSTRPD